MPSLPSRSRLVRAGLACGLLWGTAGCADVLGTAISSAPNRWIPWQKAASRTHPGIRRVLGIDQEFRVNVGTEEEPLELLVQIVDPADAAPPRGTVLVLHGVVSSGRAMLPHTRRLAHHGYRAVLVDLRGHGKSDGQYLTYGVQESDDLVRVIDALETRRLVYGEDVTGCGPLYAGHHVDGSRLVVRFTPSGRDLVATPGRPIEGFTLCGADRAFHPAEATLAGATVILHSPAVAAPVAARYAWAGFPAVSLFSRDGLPVGPFRTDDWN